MKVERIFKPCVHCGNVVLLNVVFNEKENERFVECVCGSTGPKIKNATNENQHETWVGAQQAWNKRV